MKDLNDWRKIYQEKLGVDVCDKSSVRAVSFPRAHFVYKMVGFGFSKSNVARFLNRNHSTISHILKNNEYIKDYPEIIEIENKMKNYNKEKVLYSKIELLHEIRNFKTISQVRRFLTKK